MCEVRNLSRDTSAVICAAHFLRRALALPPECESEEYVFGDVLGGGAGANSRRAYFHKPPCN